MNHHALQLAVVIVASACGRAADDECANLREPFMTAFDADLARAVSEGTAQGHRSSLTRKTGAQR